MAIINCSECGNQISDKAKKCIHCGKVFEENTTELNEMICEECGNAIPESSKECPNCGCPVSSKPKFKFKLTKKAKIILCTIIGIIIITCVGTAIYNSTPVQNYVVQVKHDRAALKVSETAFKEAKEAEKNNDYELAIKKYKAVIKEDRSYKKAQDKIAKLQDTYKNQILSEAENYAQNKKYKEAIHNVDKVITTLGSTEELTELKQKYTELKASQYAKVAVVDKLSFPIDYSARRYMESISLIMEITNNSKKSIKGIEGVMDTYDLFGKHFMSVQCDFPFNEAVKAGETTYVYVDRDCNLYIDEDAKLYNTDFSNLQFFYNITKIVYADGTNVVPE